MKPKLFLSVKMRYIFSILLVVSGLFSITPVAHGFITFTNTTLDINILIKKIHQPQWKIGYRYGADCQPADRQNGKALTEAISTSLRTWLQPLKELQPTRPIVDSFVYGLLSDFHLNPNGPDNLDELQGFDLGVTFECPQKPSHPLGSARIGGSIPRVFVRYGTEINYNVLYTLAHELGHAIGLADSYAREGFMRSRGGLLWTAGKQPAAVMAGLSNVDSNFDPSSPFDGSLPFPIGEDDKRGIIWIYKYFYENLATGDCFFADYVFDKDIRSCTPKHPLIFETKHNHPFYALRVLADDPNIDVNAQDVGGMTALHYAVMYGKEEVVKALLAHNHIKPSLKNKQGETPLDIALVGNNTAIIKMFPDPPPHKQRKKEDVNGDGAVNILDLVAVAAKFGQKDAGNADVNGDGAVDIRDLVLVAGAFGATAPALGADEDDT